MANSSIEWTDKTWNPVTGCSKISAGCKFCYAETMHSRLQAMGQDKYKDGFNVVKTHVDTLQDPYKWKKPAMVFVNSMSDLFHKDVPLDFIQQVFTVMNECPQHTFQVLTKRADIMAAYAPLLNWTDNIWLGVSVENQEQADKRIPHLLATSAKTKFLSCEPLLENISFTKTELDRWARYNHSNLLTGILTKPDGLKIKEPRFFDAPSPKIDWVIVGGESGRGKIRPMREEWAVSIMEQCKEAGVPFFFKQWGGSNKKKAGRELQGQTYDEMPKPISER